MEKAMKFKVKDEQYELDETSLTLGEARAIERVTGESFTKGKKAGVAGVQALIWVAMKRKNTRLTFAETDDIAFADLDFTDDEPADDATGDDADPLDESQPATD